MRKSVMGYSYHDPTPVKEGMAPLIAPWKKHPFKSDCSSCMTVMG